MQAEDDDALLAAATTGARRALVAGVTTMRDLGDRNYLTTRLRDSFAVHPNEGPELLVAGPPLTPTRGHCWFLGGEADGIDGLRAAVADRVARGVDVVKIMATGGLLTPGRGLHESQYNEAELFAATNAAHAAGVPVTAHAHGGAGIADALAAGVDGIETRPSLPRTPSATTAKPSTASRRPAQWSAPPRLGFPPTCRFLQPPPSG